MYLIFSTGSCAEMKKDIQELRAGGTRRQWRCPSFCGVLSGSLIHLSEGLIVTRISVVFLVFQTWNLIFFVELISKSENAITRELPDYLSRGTVLAHEFPGQLLSLGQVDPLIFSFHNLSLQ